MNGNGDLSPQDQLANFRTVTDSKLGRLDVEDLLLELLERVRGIVDANTAAVLLRSALRSYALLCSDPAEVLELTSRKIQHFEMEPW